MRQILAMLAIVLMAGGVQAQEKEITLISDPELKTSGLWSYVLPRFKLKTGIKVHVVYGSGSLNSDVLMQRDGTTPVMVRGDGLEFRATLNRASQHGTRFMEWLVSEVGQRTISAFKVDEQQVFFPAVVEVLEDSQPLKGNVLIGEETAIRKCGRCMLLVSGTNMAG